MILESIWKIKNPDAFSYAQNYVLTCQCTSKAVRKNVDGNKKEKEKLVMRVLKQVDTEKKKTEGCGMTKDQMIDEMRKINAKHKDNIESRKNALKTLMNGIQMGSKVFVLVPLEDLHVDESYQRPVQNHVKTLAQEWDDMKCDPLKINYRQDGKLYVWDGQHRLVALRIMGVDYVLCVITVGLTQEQEAELFGCQGNGIKKPDPYDIFKANVCSGEKVDTAIKQMCDKYGLVVNRSKKAGNLSCLTLARDIFRRGEEENFEWVLDLLYKAKWNEFPQSHCHRVINSLYEIRKVSGDENEYIQRKLISYLKKTNPDELLRNATVKYVQFKDESKRIKLFLLDIVNGDDESISRVVESHDRFIA